MCKFAEGDLINWNKQIDEQQPNETDKFRSETVRYSIQKQLAKKALTVSTCCIHLQMYSKFNLYFDGDFSGFCAAIKIIYYFFIYFGCSWVTEKSLNL